VESVSSCFPLILVIDVSESLFFFCLMFFFPTVYKKHYPPALDDEVWRLEKIGKDGAFHKKLNKAGIYNVKEFLRLMVKDSQKLRTVSARFNYPVSYQDVQILLFIMMTLTLIFRFLEVACQTGCGRHLQSIPRHVY